MSADPDALAWYLAYGSNMQRATLQGRLGVAVRRAVPVRAPGWRLVFDKPSLLKEIPHGYANIRPEPGAVAIGVAFEITAADLAHVELTEGVGFGNYSRVTVGVEPLAAVEDPPVTAVSLSSERSKPGCRPTTRYLGLVIEGALEHGLPEEHVAALRAVEGEEECEEAVRLRAVLDEVMRRR